MIKRAFDLVCSAAGLVVLSPLLLAVALAIRLADGGPAIYAQWRVGRHLRPFRIYKFRTMVADAERRGGGLTLHRDPRVTRLGQVLRATKLDELPQLFNVLIGDMSLVGPRPELPRYVRHFREDFAEILTIRPGVTDPASIAYRDESAMLAEGEDPEGYYLRVILPDKIRLAKQYVARHSVLLDLRLVLETVIVLSYPARVAERALDRLASHHRLAAGLLQAALAALAGVAALLLRFGGSPPAEMARLAMVVVPVSVLVRAFWFDRARLDRDVWQYFGVEEALAIALACAVGSASVALLTVPPSPLQGYPGSVIAIDGLLCATLLAGARVARCAHRRLAHKVLTRRRVLVVGTDDQAERVVHGLVSHPSYDYAVVGLVGPRPSHRGLTVHEAPILGGFGQLPEVIARHDPDEIVVVCSAVPSDERREVVRTCRQSDRLVRTVPDLTDLVSGRGPIQVVDPPASEELLFREPIEIDPAAQRRMIAGRCVLVTGAGGSIGSEISRQVAELGPSRLVLFEKHEASLYDIERSLRAACPDLAIEPVIGDVRDEARVDQVMSAARPRLVFHAAAYKHVPMMQRNATEAVKTNVLGTHILARAAERAGVHSFVLISTDKAVEPVSVMGATKRMAEIAVRSMAAAARTRFIAVRFGNVLDSSGSVLPLFREQIRNGGPVTVTHPDATRWFMTVPEAVRLILAASGIGRGGEVFVLDMGKPVRILDLARTLIRQYGLRPERDIPIVFTGLRPGERLYEKLFNDHERVWKTSHPRILMAAEGAANGHGRLGHAEEFRRLRALVEEAGGLADLRDSVAELEAACA